MHFKAERYATAWSIALVDNLIRNCIEELPVITHIVTTAVCEHITGHWRQSHTNTCKLAIQWCHSIRILTSFFCRVLLSSSSKQTHFILTKIKCTYSTNNVLYNCAKKSSSEIYLLTKHFTVLCEINWVCQTQEHSEYGGHRGLK